MAWRDRRFLKKDDSRTSSQRAMGRSRSHWNEATPFPGYPPSSEVTPSGLL